MVARQTCVFMLKNGGATGNDICKPSLWHPTSAWADTPIVLTRTDGPCFGSGDLATIFDKKSGGCILETETGNFRYQRGFPVFGLERKKTSLILRSIAARS